MEIFKNNAGVNVSVEELFKLFEHDMFDELVALIVMLDATESDGLKEDVKVEDLLKKISTPNQSETKEE